ncbi:SGNH hydrolase-type esterase domain-containing protein [Elsinoe ampelina]|uniref:SGNH hydrolase-type esterase domain-containing protein n=1 Tax=Elsinoe ampelina TaxID=302913 RepID=A0A6A6GK56_9PEZI|nr:SGNH hydrolase-type esterase domain-containing protein [Elsinoe ampelina]
MAYTSLTFRTVWLLLISVALARYTHSQNDDQRWVAVWTSMPQLTEPANLPSGTFNATPKFNDTTLRQTIKLDLPALSSNVSTRKIRLRISNAFGTTPLDITAASVARPLGNRAGVAVIEEQTVQPLTFNSGSNNIRISPGALGVSDALDFDFGGIDTYLGNGTVQLGSIITISLYLQNGQQGEAITSHPGSRTTSYLVNGNQVGQNNLTGQVQPQVHWYFISAVESLETTSAGALMVVGDSITDGRGSVPDANNRWPDWLFSRMQRSNDSVARRVAIGNQAAGGNCALSACLGPSAVSRIDRDVLAQPGVSYAMLFIGVNDIGGASADVQTQNQVADALIAGYRQIITRIQSLGLPVFGATITPFGALTASVQPYSDPAGIREQTRAKVNDWIRNGGAFDAVVDFDAAVRDPTNTTILRSDYDSGDFLHLNPAGYAAMADAFPLGLFQQFARGR